MSEDPVTRHPDELLQELLDGRLDGAAAAEIEAHLAGCARCRRLRDTLGSTRRLLRETGPEEAPAALHRQLEQALAAAGRPAAPAPLAASRRRPGRLLWPVAATVAVLAIAAVLWLRPWAAATPADPIAALARVQASADPTYVTDDAALLSERLEQQVGFTPRVLDLAMMNIALTGGDTATVAGHPTAWTLYHGPTGRLLCAMFRGRLEELPAPVEVRHRGPFTFRIYDEGGATVVAWQEGELVCVLVGRGDREQVIALAKAKAMLPTA